MSSSGVRRSVVDAERLAHLPRQRHGLRRAREDPAALGELGRVVVGPARPRAEVEEPLAFLPGDLRVGIRVQEDVPVVVGADELERARQQHPVAEHVAAHVADAHRGDLVDLRVQAELAEVAPDGLPGAAGGDAQALVVVALRAARGEGVAEPEPVLGGDRVRAVREGRGALVGGDDEVRVVPVEHPHALGVDDGGAVEVVRDVQQRADVALVLAGDLGLELGRVVGPALEVEAALGARRDDDRVLGHLRAHQPVDLRAEVQPVRPAQATAGDRAAAQVDALHRHRVHEDLDVGLRRRDPRDVGRAQLDGEGVAPGPEGVRAQGGVHERELVAQDAVLVERLDGVEVGHDLGAQLVGRLVGGAALRAASGRSPHVAQLEVAHELGRDVRLGRERLAVVLEAEARARPLAVDAVGAQQADLLPGEARDEHEPAQPVGVRLALADGQDGVREAVGHVVEVQRRAVGAEDAEVLHEGALVAARQARRPLVVHAQADHLERRQDVRQRDLAAALVERQPGARPRAALGVLEADHELLVAGLELLEALDVGRRQPRLGGRLVEVWEARAPAGGQLSRPCHAVAHAQLRGDGVLPRPDEPDDRPLDRREVRLGQVVVGRVDGEVQPRVRELLVDDDVRLDPGLAVVLGEQPLDLLHERRGVAAARDGDDDPGRPVVVRAAPEHADLVGLHGQQRDDHRAQVRPRGGEQLVLGERPEDRLGQAVVVGAVDQVLGLEDPAQLVVQQRCLGRRRGIGLGREQADQAQLADHPPVSPCRLATVPLLEAHAHVVHPHAPVHGRERVGLGDQQEVAVVDAGLDARAQLGDLEAAVGERAGPRVGQQAQPGALDHAQAPLGRLVLAVAEEGEVALQQPAQEGDRLVDLVERVLAGAEPGVLDHRPDPLAHRGVVGDDAADLGEHVVEAPLELAQLRLLQAAVELEVHDRLASGGVPGPADREQAPRVVALRADDRVHDAARPELAPLQLGRDGVDQVREVVRRRLDHRSRALVGLRREGAHHGRLPAAGSQQLERALDLGEHRLRIGLRTDLPMQVGLRERTQQRGPLRWLPLGDQGRDPVLQPLLRDGHREGTVHPRAPTARVRSAGARPRPQQRPRGRRPGRPPDPLPARLRLRPVDVARGRARVRGRPPDRPARPRRGRRFGPVGLRPRPLLEPPGLRRRRAGGLPSSST